MSQQTLLRLSFLTAITVGALAYLSIPHFMTLYASFVFELPPQTQFLFKWYRALTLIPPLSIATVWFAWPQPLTRGAATLAVSIFVALALCAFGYWAAYSPVSALAALP